MSKQTWHFLQDEKNQRMLTFIGGGFAMAAGGLWAAFVHFISGARDEARSASKTD